MSSATNGIPPVTPTTLPSVVGSRSAQVARGDSASGGNMGTFGVKSGLAQMLKGGVIMDVINAEQARIAEEAGACAVMALERVPADIRKEGGVARMSDPKMIKEIVDAVTIPVMAKCRIGHFVEAQILQSIGADYIDESEVLTPADEQHHINKHGFKVPFVCGAKNLGEALRRISEGAAFIRTKGEAGTGNVVEAVRHCRTVNAEIRRASAMGDEELFAYAKEIGAPYHLLKETARLKRLPVVNFAAGGVATPDPAKRARAIVQAVTHYNDPKVLAEVSEDLGAAMVAIRVRTSMIAITAPSPSPPASQTSHESNSHSTTGDSTHEDAVSLSRNTSIVSSTSSDSSSSSLVPPPRPRPIRTYTGPQAKNVPDVLPASPTTPKATQRTFDDYMAGASSSGRSGTPPGANITAQMAHAIAHGVNSLTVPGLLLNGISSSGTSTPTRGSPTPGTSTPNGSRSRQPSSSNTPQNYRFEGVLGEGSYSTVYSATSIVNQQVYAVKVISKRLLHRENKARYATSERAILSKLGSANHPGIIRLYSAFQDTNSLYFAFELAPNGDLFSRIRKLGSFSLEVTRYYAATILDAVAFIHSMNIIHRDLKPENILLDAKMRIKISDFGSAKDKSIAVITTSDSKPIKGSFVGTPEYASPEMLVPPTITTRASDIWAYGCVVYQFIAGRPPFKESTDYLTMKKVQEGIYTFPEGFDEVVETLVRGCLVTDPTRRTTSGQVREHSFFSTIDWDSLWKEDPPPLEHGLVKAPEPREEELRLHWSDLESSEDEMEDLIPRQEVAPSEARFRMPSVDEKPAQQILSTPATEEPEQLGRASLEMTPTTSNHPPNWVQELTLKPRRFSQQSDPSKKRHSRSSDGTVHAADGGNVGAKRRSSSASDSSPRPRRGSPSADGKPNIKVNGQSQGVIAEDDDKDSEIGSGEGTSSVGHSAANGKVPAVNATGSELLVSIGTVASVIDKGTSTQPTELLPLTHGSNAGFEKVRGARGVALVGDKAQTSVKDVWTLSNGQAFLKPLEAVVISSTITTRMRKGILPPMQRRRLLILTTHGRLVCAKELKSVVGTRRVQIDEEFVVYTPRSEALDESTPVEQNSKSSAAVPVSSDSLGQGSNHNSRSPSKRSLRVLPFSSGSSISSALPSRTTNSARTSSGGTSPDSVIAPPTAQVTKVESKGDVAFTVNIGERAIIYTAENTALANQWVQLIKGSMQL
ncbi:Pyridoxal 5'-phosphate synthase subunit snz1 [Serendipita sp. 399]|nr:Pyridoxal 5'-phosphate synthase subunit snz1 [Serendipita sp. 399]